MPERHKRPARLADVDLKLPTGLQPFVCVSPRPTPLQAWQQQWEAGGEAAAAVGAGDDDAAAAALDECCQLAESLGERFYPNEGRWAGPAP